MDWLVSVADVYLTGRTEKNKKSAPVVDWAAFEEWEDSLPIQPFPPRIKREPSRLLRIEHETVPNSPICETADVTPGPDYLLEKGWDQKTWSEDEEFWKKWEIESAAKSAEIKRNSNRYLEKINEAVLEESEKIKNEEARKIMEEKRLKEEADARKLEAAKHSSIVKPVPTTPPPAAVPSRPNSDVISKMETAFQHALETGNVHRKSNSNCRDMWKEASMSVSTLAGTLSSIQKSAKRLSDNLGKARLMGQDVANWIACVAAEKLVAQSNIHTKQMVWAQSYLLRTVGEQFPEILKIGLIGAIAKRAPFLLEDVYKTQTTLMGSADTEVKEAEVICRLFLAVSCVCGDSSLLNHWITESIRIAKNPASADSILIPLKLFCFLDIAAFDFQRIDEIGAAKCLGEIFNEVIPILNQTRGANSTREYYIDCIVNFSAQARNGIPEPAGMSLSASKETDLQS
jgi:hypothetical protein